MGRFTNMMRNMCKTGGCTIKVSIPELMKKSGRNVIVVDGFQFYGQYLYPKFDWVCCSIIELEEEVRNFVEAFKRVGVKLVFFFVEGYLDDGADKLGSETWVDRQTEFVGFSKKLFDSFSRRRPLDNLIQKRNYYNTPLHALSVVIYTLRHLLHCDVHLTHAGSRCDEIAQYTRSNDCLGLLAQDSIYYFYRGILCHLSLKNLKLNEMTTIQYNPEIFAEHEGFVGMYYPIFFDEYNILPPKLTEILKKVSRRIEEFDSETIARENVMEYINGRKVQEVFSVDCEDLEELENCICRQFAQDCLLFKFGFQYVTVIGPLTKWELIKLRAEELYTSGQMSNLIQYILMSKTYFNHSILEDFEEFPPSSLLYQPLRSKLYGILFYEETENQKQSMEIIEESSHESPDSAGDILQPGAMARRSGKLYIIHENVKPHNSNKIREWCISRRGCSHISEEVTPNLVDSSFHPGLLTLWNFSKRIPEIEYKKWQLLVSCISTKLDSNQLQHLPETLVLPAIVLYYLYQEVPGMFKSQSWKFLQPWEIEVFIAQAIMLPKSVDKISHINIGNVNVRVVKLLACFVYGCHTMRLLIEACGLPISESSLSLSHFFDGKLFHLFYERSEWRRTAIHLCDGESLSTFKQMKEIILPDISTNSIRK